MKTVIVTGCCGGLGRALCVAFRSAGYRVVGTDRLSSSDDCDVFVQFDLVTVWTAPDQWLEGINAVRAAIGAEGLAALVNNAAVQILGHVEDLTVANWQESVAVNVTAPLFLTKAFVPLLERGHGTIINVGSVHARATKPNFVAYAATKAALVGLTRALAVDLAPRVRVLAINPAAIDTSMLRAGFADRPDRLEQLAAMHPAKRLGTVDEISRLVVFLASDAATFATGAAFDVDGGILSRLHDPE